MAPLATAPRIGRPAAASGRAPARPFRLPRGGRRAALAPLLSLLLAFGCASDPPPVPPSPLASFEPTVTLARLWRSSVDEAGRGRFEPYLDAERVVVASGEGEVAAFDRRTGMRLWRTELDTRLSSGVGGSADVDAVYVGSLDGTVHALALSSGEPLWNVSMSSEVLVAPVAGFGAVIVRSVDGRVVALEPGDGSERWSVSNTPPTLTVAGYSRPLAVDGGVLVGLDDGRLLALALDTGRTIWESVLSVPSGRSEIERLVDIDADPLVDDAGIYVVNYQGQAARLEPVRGQLVWSVPMSSTAGLALGGTRLVVVDEEDVLHALERDSGREIWSSEVLRGRRLSPPAALAGGEAVVVGDLEGYLHVVSLEDGALLGRARVADGPITVRPVVDGDTVYTQGEDGRVAAHTVAR